MINKPNFNWNIIGHEKILKYLEYFIINNKLSHAYLFHGTRYLTKKEIVKQFIANIYCFDNARRNNFENLSFPCNTCVHCTQLAKNLHSDLYWIKKEINSKTKKAKKNISIEQVRDLISNLYTAKFLNSYKIGVIEEAQIMSESAFNSLLKILEEPPKNVIIILIANSLSNIPKTIISRCQNIQFYPVPNKKIKNYLLSQNSDYTHADNISSLANGKPEIAVKYHLDKKALTEYLETINKLLELTNNNNFEKFKIIDSLSKTFKDSVLQQQYISELLNIWTIILRDIMLLKQGLDDFINHKIIYSDLKKISSKTNNTSLIKLLKNIKKIQNLLLLNVNQKLALENIIINI